MESVILAGVAITAFAGFVKLIRHRRVVFRRWTKALLVVCDELGFEFHDDGGYRPDSASKKTEAGTLTVDIVKHTPRGRSGAFGVTRIMVNADHLIPNNLELGIKVVNQATTASFLWNANLRTGDATFDARVYVRGDSPVVISLLDEHTRSVILDILHGCDARVAAGLVETFILGICTDTDRLVARAQATVDLARQLARPYSEAPARLAHNVENDPLWQVRLTNLEALEHRYSESKELKNAALNALEEESPAIRLVA